MRNGVLFSFGATIFTLATGPALADDPPKPNDPPAAPLALTAPELSFLGGTPGDPPAPRVIRTAEKERVDVVFTVPVRFELIHESVQKVVVECAMSRTRMPDGRASHVATSEIARGATRFAVGDRRSFIADVPVSLTRHTGRSLDEARVYSCWYSFEGGAADGRVGWRAFTPLQYQAYTKSKVAGSSPNFTVNGDLAAKP